MSIHSKTDSTQPLNSKVGFNENYIERQIEPFNRKFHSKTDSTIQPKNRIQFQFHSNTDPTIKTSNRIQCESHSKTDSTIKPTNGI